MKIEVVSPATFEKVLPLIERYQEFYQMIPDRERVRAFFRRFLDDHSVGIQFVALDTEGTALGFATLYFLPSSLSATMGCTLNDLYVIPSSRGMGIARKLVQQAREHARELGFERIDWMTQRSNSTAQTLYDQLGADRSEWYYYSLKTAH